MKTLISATSTPLASIFGSGFLIIVPILNGAVGKYAVFAMALVCMLAYCIGYVIRFNIKNVEPLVENDTASKRTQFLERTSDLALVAAYVATIEDPCQPDIEDMRRMPPRPRATNRSAAYRLRARTALQLTSMVI